MRTLVLLALLAACGGTSGISTGGGNPTGGGTTDAGTDGGTAVTIEWTFVTGDAGVTTTVAAGTPVRWHNGDLVTHSVVPATTPPPNSTGNIVPGATSANQTISTPGTYHFICGIHGPVMSGTLVVQ
jgi:hypothetical protein